MKKTIDFLTPTEVIEKYPELADNLVGAQKILEYFLSIVFFWAILILHFVNP
jgi:hypothetical protein